MTNSVTIEMLRKKLEDHERRIVKLEEACMPMEKNVSARKAGVSKRLSIFDWLKQLKSEGFFDRPRFSTDIVARLAEKGYHYPPQSLTEPLQRAIKQKVLGRLKKNGIWAYVKR
ncbi:MAG: hypothetical protein FJ006_05325 [Chloroflexi bacterium]|nr:hypothetical protein [Chloroflexota bacterium]